MAKNRLFFLFSPFAFSALRKACSYFEGAEVAHIINRDPCTVPGIPGLSHFCCRALKVLHFVGNLSKESEGLILQTAITPIVLNKAFRGLIKIPLTSRKMVDFIDWITFQSVRVLEGLPVPWTVSWGCFHTGSALSKQDAVPEHVSRAWEQSLLIVPNKAKQWNTSSIPPENPVRSKRGQGQRQAGDKATAWVQSLSRRDCQRHGGREAARWEPSRCQAVSSIDLMLVWDTGPGLESLHSVAWEAETAQGQSCRPWSPVQGVWAGGRAKLWGLSGPEGWDYRSLCWPGYKVKITGAELQMLVEMLITSTRAWN